MPGSGPAGRGGPSRWASLTGGAGAAGTAGDVGERYAAQFARIAASGVDVHGEATFCASLVPPGARVLDAGCGTGRVAVRLAGLGYLCTGVDVDPSMLARARAGSEAVTWILADLAHLDEAFPVTGDPSAPGVHADADRTGVSFDLVVAAGNVIPLLAPGTEAGVVRALAALLRPGGLLVAGFGLDAAHLPLPQAPFGLVEYDRWCREAGLERDRRFATWDGAEHDPSTGYAVSVHRRS